ncbi:MAG: matrixin family metalloprotease, partial [Gemmataceae bacterium]
QAQIDAAIAELNGLLGSRGVNLVEIHGDDSVDADVHLHVAGTSVIGGVDQGVLGVTQQGIGEITIISGWNYYFGGDASAVGADQYDFETVVMHELGHSIGLGHSQDTGSVMYPYLATSQARRALTASDLAIIDSESGTDPLLAAPQGYAFRSLAESEGSRAKEIAATPIALSAGTPLVASSLAGRLEVAADRGLRSLPASPTASTDAQINGNSRAMNAGESPVGTTVGLDRAQLAGSAFLNLLQDWTDSVTPAETDSGDSNAVPATPETGAVAAEPLPADTGDRIGDSGSNDDRISVGNDGAEIAIPDVRLSVIDPILASCLMIALAPPNLPARQPKLNGSRTPTGRPRVG